MAFSGYALTPSGAGHLIGDTGITMTRSGSTITLSGSASGATYTTVLESLTRQGGPDGLARGVRNVSVTVRDPAGLAGTMRTVAVTVQDSWIAGTAANATLNGTAGHDTFDGGAGNETMRGHDGADLFIVEAGNGNDVIIGGTGSWIDTIRVTGSGAPGGGGWTLVVDGASTPTAADGQTAFDFAQPTSGTIHFSDGSRVEFAQIERITW